MAKVHYNKESGDVVVYEHALIGAPVDIPDTDAFVFDADTNPVAVAALQNEPGNVKVVDGQLLYHGVALKVHEESKANAERRTLGSVQAALEADQRITPADTRTVLLYLVRTVRQLAQRAGVE